MNPCCAAFLYAFYERSILADRIFLQDRYFHQLFAPFHLLRDEEDLPCTATFFGKISDAGICTLPVPPPAVQRATKVKRRSTSHIAMHIDTLQCCAASLWLCAGYNGRQAAIFHRLWPQPGIFVIFYIMICR
jgi:hypothetical protein